MKTLCNRVYAKAIHLKDTFFFIYTNRLDAMKRVYKLKFSMPEYKINDQKFKPLFLAQFIHSHTLSSIIKAILLWRKDMDK